MFPGGKDGCSKSHPPSCTCRTSAWSDCAHTGLGTPRTAACSIPTSTISNAMAWRPWSTCAWCCCPCLPSSPCPPGCALLEALVSAPMPHQTPPPLPCDRRGRCGQSPRCPRRQAQLSRVFLRRAHGMTIIALCCLLGARQCPKSFTSIHSLSPQNNPISQMRKLR